MMPAACRLHPVYWHKDDHSAKLTWQHRARAGVGLAAGAVGSWGALAVGAAHAALARGAGGAGSQARIAADGCMVRAQRAGERAGMPYLAPSLGTALQYCVGTRC